VLVWEVAAHAYRWIERDLPVRFLRVALSPDGTRLASGGSDGYMYLWDVVDGTILYKWAQHQGSTMSVAWNMDGTRLASGSRGEILVWNTHNGEHVQTLSGSSGLVSALCWGTRGEHADVLVSGGSDGTLRWWNVRSGECLWMRQAHRGMIQSLRCSPDGTRLASCSDDGTIMLWNLHSGECLRTLRRDRPYERLNITGITGLSEIQKNALRALGAFEETNSTG
jgi:WD40 repeat protein